MNNRDRFDKFTERARKVLSLSQEEAQRFQHNYIGTEHLLLGLIREGEGVAAKVLLDMGVSLNQARSTVEYIIGRGDRIVLGEIGLTPRAKKVIELAVDEARRLNHHYIGTEHLLLGLIREGEGIASGVLQNLGVKLEDTRRETLRVLGQKTEDVSKKEAQFVESAASASTLPTGEMNIQEASTDNFEIDDEDRVPVPRTPGQTTDDKFDKFTIRARKVLSLAQEEAQRFQHNYIGTEHLLLGLTRDDKGVAAQVLHSLGAELSKVRSAIEYIIGHGDRIVLGNIGLTPRAKKVIELSIDEARRLNHPYVGTGHLLLGMIREGEGIAAGVLESMGINLERTRVQTIRVLNKPE